MGLLFPIANNEISRLREECARHARVVLAFSGGKDSLACLELLRLAGVRPALLWINTGATLPHMDAFIRRAADGFELIEVRTDQQAFWRKHGIPSRIVPMFNHRAGLVDDPHTPRPLIVDWQTCHAELISLPARKAIEASGASLVVYGERDDDGHLSIPLASGVETVRPLAKWTEAQVFDFLRERRVELPAQYPDVVDSLGCPNCPALTTPAIVHWLQRFAPDTAAEVVGNISMTLRAVGTEVQQRLIPILAAGSTGTVAQGISNNPRGERPITAC